MSDTIKDLEREIDLFHTNIKESNALMQTLSALPAEIKRDAGQSYEAFLFELKQLLDSHEKQLAKTEAQVAALEQQLAEKYTAFLAKLEATKLDCMHAEVKEMQRSLTQKLYIAMGGIGVAVLCALLAIFL